MPRAFVRDGSRVPGFLAFQLVIQPHNILVRDFPTKMSCLAALHQTLLQENGAPRVGHKYSGSGQNNVTGAVMHLDPAPEQIGVAGHTQPVSKPIKIRSIVPKDSPAKTCGKTVKKQPKFADFVALVRENVSHP